MKYRLRNGKIKKCKKKGVKKSWDILCLLLSRVEDERLTEQNTLQNEIHKARNM